MPMPPAQRTLSRSAAVIVLATSRCRITDPAPIRTSIRARRRTDWDAGLPSSLLLAGDAAMIDAAGKPAVSLG